MSRKKAMNDQMTQGRQEVLSLLTSAFEGSSLAVQTELLHFFDQTKFKTELNAKFQVRGTSRPDAFARTLGRRFFHPTSTRKALRWRLCRRSSQSSWGI